MGYMLIIIDLEASLDHGKPRLYSRVAKRDQGNTSLVICLDTFVIPLLHASKAYLRSIQNNNEQ